MSAPIQLPPPPPLRQRSVGDILGDAFRLYGKHWLMLVQVVAVVAVPLTLIQYLVTDQLAENVIIRRDVGGGTIEIVAESELWRDAVTALVVAIVSLLVTQVLIGAIAWTVAGILVGREPSISDSYRFGAARIWSILLVSVLSALAIIGGFILLVIPGFIILTHLVCSIPAVVVEGKRGRAALSRSWRLVRGRAWPVFGAIVVTGILTGFVSSVLTAPAGEGWFAQGLLASLASVITTPFTALVVGLLYFDLRVRKESLDVMTLDRELRAAAP
ncbi:MAG: glycerophosphoryl diester phosphodiesterase membrane domain-containing protein [Actinomycetota bacterium]